MSNLTRTGRMTFENDYDQSIHLTWDDGRWWWEATVYRPGDSSRKIVGRGNERSAAMAAAAATRALLVFWSQEK